MIRCAALLRAITFRAVPFRAARRAPLLATLLVAALACGLAAPLEAREVVLATTPWEPYIGPDLPRQGYVAEVAREALAQAGHTLRLEFMPWGRVLYKAEHGEVDGYLPEYPSEELKRTFLFSDPFPGGPLGFFKLRANKDISWCGLDSLRPYRIGVVRGYVNEPAFDARTDLKREYAKDDEANLRMLLAGRVDLIVADLHVGRHYARRISRQAQGRIEFLLPPLETKHLHACFPVKRPGSLRLAQEFNRGLDRLRRTGRLELLRARHNLHSAPTR